MAIQDSINRLMSSTFGSLTAIKGVEELKKNNQNKITGDYLNSKKQEQLLREKASYITEPNVESQVNQLGKITNSNIKAKSNVDKINDLKDESNKLKVESKDLMNKSVTNDNIESMQNIIKSKELEDEAYKKLDKADKYFKGAEQQLGNSSSEKKVFQDMTSSIAKELRPIMFEKMTQTLLQDSIKSGRGVVSLDQVLELEEQIDNMSPIELIKQALNNSDSSKEYESSLNKYDESEKDLTNTIIKLYDKTKGD